MTRRFDIKTAKPGGMKEGDTFIGCTSCSFMVNPGEMPGKMDGETYDEYKTCPECGGRLGIYKVVDSGESEKVGNWLVANEEKS